MKKQKKTGFSFIHIFFISAFVAGLTFLCLSIFIPAKKTSIDDGQSTVINETTSPTKESNEVVSPEDKTPKQYEDDEKTRNNPNEINASITKNEIINGKYILRVTIYELLADGTCTLHLENNGNTLDRTVKIINAGADSSSCDGFDIKDINKFLDAGTYNLTIDFESNGKKGNVKGTIKI